MTFTKSPIALAIFTSMFASNTLAAETQTNATTDIEQITVTSSFKNQSLAQVPTSVAIIGQQQINDQAIQHFEELINGVANLNFSGGTSRPKYLQIRGVGERSEYRGAPNSSVGFIVDDINLSGLGMAASMYDVQQVEVLRGPQGARFGANALAGLIYIKSNAPSQSPAHGLKATVGNDDLLNLAGYSAGAINDAVSYRFSVEQHQQNGHRNNHYLNTDDSNGIDEFSGKFKLRYQASDDLSLNLTYLFANNDNGFDAWTLDNNGFTTLTDEPGVDKQKSHGSALKFSYEGFSFAKLSAITSFTTTKHQHAYDGDWANPDYWASKACADGDNTMPCQYSYLWDKQADRDIWSQEFRLISNEYSRIFSNSTDWLLGSYFSKLKENNNLDSSYNGWPDEILDSSYSAHSYALFSQFDTTLDDAYQLSVGMRVEKRITEYVDSAGDKFQPSETMWGGHIALSKAINNQHSAYIRVAQGYKAGGFNMGLPVQLRQYKEFDTETLVNYELGLKSSLLDNALISRLAVFYMDRKDQQVNASQQNPDKPQQFTIYTANATSSNSYGLELELNYQISDNLSIDSTIGYLKARYNDYAYMDKYGANIDISGRELAHAPNYTFSLGGTYRNDNGLVANLHWTGKDEFYFSDSHGEKSASSNLLNAKIGYEFSAFSIALWARNITDEKVATRGFFFGNEPDLDWAAKKYVRYGAPRQIGLTLEYNF